MLIGSFACCVLIPQDGRSLVPSGIKIFKALHLVVREIAFEAMIYICH